MRIHNLTVDFDALLIEDPIDLFYLTGIELSQGQLVVTKEEATLYVDGRYIEEAGVKSPIPVKEELQLSGRVAFDSSKTSYGRYLELKEMCEPIGVDAPVRSLRMIKEPEEVERLKRAAELGVRGYEEILNGLKEGVTEKEMVVELEIFWKRSGGSDAAFSPIIAFGENSSKPHYHASNRRLRSGDVVLIDIGVTLEHYHSDMTRVFFFGMPDPEIEKIYNVVKEAQARAIKACRPGIEVGELDLVARDYITQEGYGGRFIHSLGHGLGLEVHEFPRIHHKGRDRGCKLQPGMVITIEPGIYLPKVGGVRLEDTLLITEEGFCNLTNSPH